jgi:hypothetical protein
LLLSHSHTLTTKKSPALFILFPTHILLTMPTLAPKTCHISPRPPNSRDFDDADETLLVEPQDDELSEGSWTKVHAREWSDEQLMNDARSGRRIAASEANECDSGDSKYARRGRKKGCAFIQQVDFLSIVFQKNIAFKYNPKYY